jgi:hypothetical protein
MPDLSLLLFHNPPMSLCYVKAMSNHVQVKKMAPLKASAVMPNGQFKEISQTTLK